MNAIISITETALASLLTAGIKAYQEDPAKYANDCLTVDPEAYGKDYAAYLFSMLVVPSEVLTSVQTLESV